MAELIQKYFDKQFGKMIRQRRNGLDMSLVRLADKCGVSFSLIAKIENGESHAKEEMVKKLAEVLEIDNEKALRKAGYIKDDIDKYEVSIINKNENKLIDENKTDNELIELYDRLWQSLSQQKEWLNFIDEMADRKLSPDDIRSILTMTLSFSNGMQRYLNRKHES
jgi:transcriptional regulator with XRE-family HTH domain